jgi:hypothetical protein
MTTEFSDTPPFVIVFWTGGSESGNWHRTLPFALRDEAQQAANATVRMGYAAYVKSIREIEIIGMPDGPPPFWDFHNLCWKLG